MPRPRKCRTVYQHPPVVFFKPQGVPMHSLQGVVLPVENLEALRLADVEGMDQEDAARLMGVSRPTFSRILSEARGLAARALVNGWAIRIEGGDYELATDPDFGRGGGCRRRSRCRRKGGQ
ncbi:DUF134 domain-containing protein [Thermodesulfobacteriota bacterium]